MPEPETIRLEIGFDPTNPALRKWFEKAGERAGDAFTRKMHEMCCEANGHEFEPCPERPDIPWDAICKWCHYARPKVTEGSRA